MVTESIRAIFTTNLGVRKEERVLVFTDRIRETEIIDVEDRCRRERLLDIALLTEEIGRAFAKKVFFHEYTSTLSHGAEPPEDLWRVAFGERTVDMLKAAGLFQSFLAKRTADAEIEKAEDIVRKQCRSAVHAVIALSNYSTSHTRFRDLLTRVCGCRYASMPLFDMNMFEGSMNVEWRALARRTSAIAQKVNKAENVEVKTPNGTHLALSKRGRKALPDTGILTQKGSFGNLPAGEVYLAPREGTANGQLVLEWAQTRELKIPVTLTVKDGLVVKIEGDEPFAKVLDAKLEERAENRNIAELGIGTNHKAWRPDNILESEKILGTIHVALGDNSSFGGTVETPFHQDFVFFKPTVVLIDKDGKRATLLKSGRFTGEAH
ncbi:MAG: aminopeptidase [Thermodesulfovibrionales bacterium]|jgi:leucyl aminopeptidase (aminopeptidase T)